MRLAIAALFAYVISGCINNDLPYPWILPNVTDFQVQETDAEGHDLLMSPVEVDSVNRTISIYLTEWADIRAVKVTKWELSDGSECLTPEIFESPLDLTSPLEVTFTLYDREFVWTITATQHIDRFFTVASQIGTSQIDVENHTVKALVPLQQPLDNITVRTIKLSGSSGVMEPDLKGQKVDFTSPVVVKVTEFGQTVDWTITVEQTEVSVELERVDAFTKIAWLYANAQEGKANGFEYRQYDAEEWIAVPDEWITHPSPGSFVGQLRHLEPETRYVARAISDDENSVEVEFTTGSVLLLPNNRFTDWWRNGTVWLPYQEGGEQFWDTGNEGAKTLKGVLTEPILDGSSSTGYQGAYLETKFVGIAMLGKLGAGNLFAGRYVETQGTNGILAFGRPFNARPTALKAIIKYETAPISNASAKNPDFTYMKGQPDTCIIWCALADFDQPFEIRTNPNNRQLFSPKVEGVIAYGEFQSGNSIEDYFELTVPLEYNFTDRVPKYILVTFSASKYGDYFTGGKGAKLYVKETWLEYDVPD